MNKLAFFKGYNKINKLDPGVYMGARRIKGSPIGRHQFFVLVPKDVTKFDPKLLRDVGGGNRGIVISAYNKDGNLTATENYAGDLEALAGKYRGRKNKYGTQLQRLKFNSYNNDELVRRALQAHRTFKAKAAKNPIKYPLLGLGVNSNSYAQALRNTIGGKEIIDFKGFNPGENKIQPVSSYFKAASEFNETAFMLGYTRNRIT
jgi:hypothetical protein